MTKTGDPSEQTAETLLAQALRLTEPERLEIAAALLGSLQGPDDDTSDDEWLAELQRRADSVRSGQAGALHWTALREDLLDELRGRRS